MVAYSKLVRIDYTSVEIRWRTGANRGQPVPGALPRVGSKGREPFRQTKVPLGKTRFSAK